jgi:hypothetical protein
LIKLAVAWVLPAALIEFLLTTTVSGFSSGVESVEELAKAKANCFFFSNSGTTVYLFTHSM